MSVGERWKQAREAAGLSAAKAALVTGLHENTIYLLENDRKNDGVTVRICKQVADAYGVTLGQIFCDEPDVTAVPPEVRPLTDLLAPLSAEARVSFIRNVVANARFMGQLVGTPSDVEHSAPVSNVAYASPHKNGDERGAVVTYGHGQLEHPSIPRPTNVPQTADSKRKGRS